MGWAGWVNGGLRVGWQDPIFINWYLELKQASVESVPSNIYNPDKLGSIHVGSYAMR